MKKSLTLDQTKRLLALTASSEQRRGHPQNRALFLAVLLCGAPARSWTWEDALSDVIGMPFAVYYALRDMACDKKLSIFPFHHARFDSAHWISGSKLQNAVFTSGSRYAAKNKGAATRSPELPLTTQEVTRRLKVYGRRAGIKASEMSLRTLANTGESFQNLYGDADRIAELLGIADVTTVTRRTPPAGTTRRMQKAEGRVQTAESSVMAPFLSVSVKVERDPRLHGLNRRSSMKTA